MQSMMKWLARFVAGLIVLFVAAFLQLFFSSRPPLTIDPATLAGDGSTIDDCDLPVLDGQGKMAAGASVPHRVLPEGTLPDASTATRDHIKL
jgi:hypothetical protein